MEDNILCTNCCSDLESEEQFLFKDNIYCCDCVLGACIEEGYVEQIK